MSKLVSQLDSMMEPDSGSLTSYLNDDFSDLESENPEGQLPTPNPPEMVRSILNEIALERAPQKVRIALKTYKRLARTKDQDEITGFHLKKSA